MFFISGVGEDDCVDNLGRHVGFNGVLKAKCEAYARSAHQSLLRSGLSREDVPLLTLNLSDWSTPFSEASTTEGASAPDLDELPLLPVVSTVLSSTFVWQGHADLSSPRCADGRLDTFCHSISQSTPWLSLDLGTDSAVGYVVIRNRRDCCQNRLTPFELHVGGANHDASRCELLDALTDLQAQDYTLACHGLVGRFVTLVLPGEERTLHVAEVAVYGTAR